MSDDTKPQDSPIKFAAQKRAERRRFLSQAGLLGIGSLSLLG